MGHFIVNLLNYLSTVPDFPKPGIRFKDISPLLADQAAFSYANQALYDLSLFCEYDYLLGVESRGFIFAAALSPIAKTGLILARKPNKLPGSVYSESYGLEYGSDALEIQQNLIRPQSRVLIIDDVLATGGTLIAAANLVKKANAIVAGAIVLLEIEALQGNQRLAQAAIPVKSLLKI
jgi:adenine phosphoribosyltransferase